MLKLIRVLFGNKLGAPMIATDNLLPDALPYQIERIASAQQLEELKKSADSNLVILIGDSHSVGNLSASLGSLSSTPEEILANASTFNLREWVSADAKATALEELGTSLGEWPDSSPEPAPAVHPSLAENLINAVRSWQSSLATIHGPHRHICQLVILISARHPTFMLRLPRNGLSNMARK